MENELDIYKVMEYLPHRYPFLLIDKVTDYVPGGTLTAVKNVTINEPFFQGHYPDNPVMPGVLILEAMAQACALLAGLSYDAKAQSNRIYLFVGADRVRFRKQVIPGDQLVFNVSLGRMVKSILNAEGTVLVDGKRACTGSIMFTYRDI